MAAPVPPRRRPPQTTIQPGIVLPQTPAETPVDAPEEPTAVIAAPPPAAEPVPPSPPAEVPEQPPLATVDPARTQTMGRFPDDHVPALLLSLEARANDPRLVTSVEEANEIVAALNALSQLDANILTTHHDRIADVTKRISERILISLQVYNYNAAPAEEPASPPVEEQPPSVAAETPPPPPAEVPEQPPLAAMTPDDPSQLQVTLDMPPAPPADVPEPPPTPPVGLRVLLDAERYVNSGGVGDMPDLATLAAILDDPALVVFHQQTNVILEAIRQLASARVEQARQQLELENRAFHERADQARLIQEEARRVEQEREERRLINQVLSFVNPDALGFVPNTELDAVRDALEQLAEAEPTVIVLFRPELDEIRRKLQAEALRREGIRHAPIALSGEVTQAIPGAGGAPAPFGPPPPDDDEEEDNDFDDDGGDVQGEGATTQDLRTHTPETDDRGGGVTRRRRVSFSNIVIVLTLMSLIASLTLLITSILHKNRDATAPRRHASERVDMRRMPPRVPVTVVADGEARSVVTSTAVDSGRQDATDAAADETASVTTVDGSVRYVAVRGIYGLLEAETTRPTFRVVRATDDVRLACQQIADAPGEWQRVPFEQMGLPFGDGGEGWFATCGNLPYTERVRVREGSIDLLPCWRCRPVTR